MTLRALVVFESMFGNTEKVAAAVARGPAARGHRHRAPGGARGPGNLVA